MATKKAGTETTAAKKPAVKKPEVVKAEPAAAKKTVTRKPAAKKTAEVIVQSPLGGEISFAEIMARVGSADKIYVRVDQNKAYWVRGDETGSIDLW